MASLARRSENRGHANCCGHRSWGRSDVFRSILSLGDPSGLREPLGRSLWRCSTVISDPFHHPISRSQSHGRGCERCPQEDSRRARLLCRGGIDSLIRHLRSRGFDRDRPQGRAPSALTCLRQLTHSRGARRVRRTRQSQTAMAMIQPEISHQPQELRMQAHFPMRNMTCNLNPFNFLKLLYYSEQPVSSPGTDELPLC